MEIQKTKYNKEYYLAHPELKEKARERERKKRVQSIAYRNSKLTNGKPSPTSSQISRSSVQFEAILLPVLLLTVTFLLLREMISFYSEPNASQIIPVVKALAVEGVILVFSFLTDSRAFMRALYKSLAVALCLFSTYAMCSKHFSDAVISVNSFRITERAIVDLETAIQRKQTQADELFSKGWISAARKTESAIDSLREQLQVLRAQVINAKPVAATASTTFAQIIFRVLLMLTNILAAHRFGQILKFLESFKIGDEILARDLEISKKRLKFQEAEKARESKQGPQFQFPFFKEWSGGAI
jgi:hypothetical protein